jgi:diadenylate cyclase
MREEELEMMLQEIVQAAEGLCRSKAGALIVIERNNPLTAYIKTGVYIDGRVSAELIETVFTRDSILHDGGLVIQQGRIVAAGCLFPLTENQELSRVFGTRHRAALGLSEETDAIIVVVSEERHDISIVYRGRLYKDLSKDDVIATTKEIIKQEKERV